MGIFTCFVQRGIPGTVEALKRLVSYGPKTRPKAARVGSLPGQVLGPADPSDHERGQG